MTKKKPPADQVFTFEHEGKSYWLAPGGTKVRDLPGRLYRDALMAEDDDNEARNRLRFALLEIIDAQDGALDALYAKPLPEMMETIRKWELFKVSEKDADLGESSASSN